MESGARERRGRIKARPSGAGEAGPTAGSSAAGRRGQTAVIAIVLLVGLVAVGSIGILLLGGQANEEGKQRAEAERVEQAFLELDRDVDSVGRSEAGERTVDLDLPAGSEAAVREEVSGRIWINRTNFTTGNTDTLVNRSIGSIRYTSDEGTTLAFQAGGVWKEEGNDTRMVSPPAISYDLDANGNGPTLTVPIVTTSGDTRLEGGKVRVRKNRTLAPVNDRSIVENDLVSMTVQSRWYVGWAEFFRQLTNAPAVSVDHQNRTATVEMVVPAVAPTVDSGIAAGAANSNLVLQQGNQTVDSYDSTVGPYTSTATDEGDVVVAGTLKMTQDAEIRGNVEAGGDVKFQGSARITGNLSNTTSMSYTQDGPKEGSPPHVDGWVAPNASIRPRTAVNGYIDLNVGSIRDDNDNGSASAVTADGDLVDPCDPCTLTSGSYYLDELHLSGGEELILDTTGGPINLAVNETVEVEGSSTRVRIRGSGRVNVFVNGVSAGNDPEFEMASGARWLVEDGSGTRTDAAPQSWVYLDSGGQAKIGQDGTVFTGVLYGPGGVGAGGVEINVLQEAKVYGALVGDVQNIKQNTRVHYDQALQNAVPVTTNVAIPRLTFLHVAVHEVEVEEDD